MEQGQYSYSCSLVPIDPLTFFDCLQSVKQICLHTQALGTTAPFPTIAPPQYLPFQKYWCGYYVWNTKDRILLKT